MPLAAAAPVLARISGTATSTIRAKWSGVSVEASRSGWMPDRNSTSDLNTLPMPATTRWSSSASAIGRGPAPAIRLNASSRSKSGESRSGPSVLSARLRPRSRVRRNSATGTSNATATQVAVSMPTRIALGRRCHRSPGRYRCHDPLIRMCVRSTSSPENVISRCLPTDSQRSIVRPVIGESSCTRASGASAVSNPVTTSPASARWRAAAARKIVSPSGTLQHLLVARELPEQDAQAHEDVHVLTLGTRSCSPPLVTAKPASSSGLASGVAVAGMPLISAISQPRWSPGAS